MSDPEKNRSIVSATLVIAYVFFRVGTLLTEYSTQGAVWTSDQQNQNVLQGIVTPKLPANRSVFF
jgi:hypothetical protein